MNTQLQNQLAVIVKDLASHVDDSYGLDGITIFLEQSDQNVKRLAQQLEDGEETSLSYRYFDISILMLDKICAHLDEDYHFKHIVSYIIDELSFAKWQKHSAENIKAAIRLAYLRMLADMVEELRYTYYQDRLPLVAGVYQGKAFDSIHGLYEMLFLDGRES
ncbi:hypothetical protein B0181_07910 [Moraxella caviae]|uniref:Uncharacterized protein n=1 Tax=Moraxella caviae TaxID=34060 RepID=A0A1S9ZYQ1_9GAMM|nr:hypothetical protein [Moraxella caviae]OOR88632.1 hypothetical protein B0181_07910 [Moraxella caviae]STZ13685.1 Uncharacterised protein [Moraxella caviae]